MGHVVIHIKMQEQLHTCMLENLNREVKLGDRSVDGMIILR